MRRMRRGGAGITPAYAGKSQIPCRRCSNRWDHPRIRGEKFAFNPRTTCRSGSPPHTRGKAVSEGDGHIALGITPAYAGKRSAPCCATSIARDHPRIRGEKATLRHQSDEDLGSPPHTRGKEGTDGFLGQKTGITPAYAGKSAAASPPAPRWRDHPRIRGEKKNSPPFLKAVAGSPPHTRGKALFQPVGDADGGITPAYAGKRYTVRFAVPLLWDHPRIRGEKHHIVLGQAAHRGSPPHTRGKAPLNIRNIRSAGITPAYAGKR